MRCALGGTQLRGRSGPGTGSPVIGTEPSGASFALNCQWQGSTNIGGNSTWDDVTFANGITGAITDFDTTTPSWNSYAPGTGPCGSTPAGTIHSLGGVSMQQACNVQYSGQGLTAVATNVNSAYSWQCQKPGVSRGIDVTAECALEYGNGALADVTNPNSAWSWYCHWSVGRTVTSNTGVAGQCVWWVLNEFHQYDGWYPNTIDAGANNGNAMYLAANAAFNGWTVSSTPRGSRPPVRPVLVEVVAVGPFQQGVQPEGGVVDALV